jgi:hypothetical protein
MLPALIALFSAGKVQGRCDKDASKLQREAVRPPPFKLLIFSKYLENLIWKIEEKG